MKNLFKYSKYYNSSNYNSRNEQYKIFNDMMGDLLGLYTNFNNIEFTNYNRKNIKTMIIFLLYLRFRLIFH